MKTELSFLAPGLLLLVAPVAFGAEAQAPAPPIVTITSSDLPNLRLTLKSVTESRTRPPAARTGVTMEVQGDGLTAPVVVRNLTVTKAIDNLGQAVGPSTTPGSNAMSAVFALSNSQADVPRSPEILANVALALLPRSTVALQTLEGTLELFAPTEANGGILRLPNIKLHAGRLENPEFAKRGISFFYLASPEDFAEAQRQLASGGGRGGMSSVGTKPDGRTMFGYAFQDTTGTVAGAQLQDAKGNPLPTRENGGVSGANAANMNYLVPGGIPDDAQLVVYLAVPEAIKKVSFRLENVPLP